MMKVLRYKIFESRNITPVLFQKLLDRGFTIESSHNEIMVSLDGKYVGDFRFSTYERWLIMEMISLESEFQRRGLGMKIYSALLETALETGYRGIASLCFDIGGSGQQRSPAATALLNKMVRIFGGYIKDANDEIDEEFIEEMEDEGVPHYGPPYQNIFIDGSKKFKGVI